MLKIGSIGWVDLTVPDAGPLRDFYSRVTGWSTSDIDMGGYSDFCMNTEEGTSVAGVCNARGSTVGLPAQWIIYVTVSDLDASMQACRDAGGEVIFGPKKMGEHARFCIIRDPAAAVCGLYQE